MYSFGYSSDSIRQVQCLAESTDGIVMDDFSVEIFEGGRSLTSTIYLPENADGLELTVKAESWQYEKADILLKV